MWVLQFSVFIWHRSRHCPRSLLTAMARVWSVALLPHPFTASIKYPELTCNSEFYRFRSTDFTQYIFANITPLRLICGLINPPCTCLGYFLCGLLFSWPETREQEIIYYSRRESLCFLYITTSRNFAGSTQTRKY